MPYSECGSIPYRPIRTLFECTKPSGPRSSTCALKILCCLYNLLFEVSGGAQSKGISRIKEQMGWAYSYCIVLMKSDAKGFPDPKTSGVCAFAISSCEANLSISWFPLNTSANFRKRFLLANFACPVIGDSYKIYAFKILMYFIYASFSCVHGWHALLHPFRHWTFQTIYPKAFLDCHSCIRNIGDAVGDRTSLTLIGVCL